MVLRGFVEGTVSACRRGARHRHGLVELFGVAEQLSRHTATRLQATDRSMSRLTSERAEHAAHGKLRNKRKRSDRAMPIICPPTNCFDLK
jgi:hypothetical protein